MRFHFRLQEDLNIYGLSTLVGGGEEESRPDP